MKIFGLEKLSMVDYPGHLCCTIFTGGCNFRCPFCQNSDLVNMTHLKEISLDEFFDFLKKRKGVLDSVCISGGEPSIYPDLPAFIQTLKQQGLLVKLDTNGTNFEMLKSLIDEKLVDYVAMDIKNSQTGYALTAGIANLQMDSILKSVELLKSNVVAYEFRTTLIKSHHTEKNISDMADWLCGAEKLFLQHFVDSGTCLQPGLEEVPNAEAQKFKEILAKSIKHVELRGY